MRRLLLLALAVLALAGCTPSTGSGRLFIIEAHTSDERPATFLDMPLQTGQLVLSEAPGAYSLMFTLSTEAFFNFTHAGVIVFEDGEPYVYEMTGEYKLGLAEVPTDGIVGECLRRPFLDYCKANLYVEVLDLPEGVDPGKVAGFVKKVYEEQPEFDPYFDYSEHEKLFCTEFVQLALESGGAEPLELVKVRRHESIQRMLGWFKVARDVALPAGLFHDRARCVASLGQLPNLSNAYSYFAAKEELHRRFRDDQQLGNLFLMEGVADIRLRRTIVQFMGKAINLFAGQGKKLPPRDVITRKVRELADEVFGSGPTGAEAGGG